LTSINFSLPHSHQRISHHKFLFRTVHLIFTEYTTVYFENAHAHILNTFIGQSVTIPIREGRPLLGTWQAILYIELDGGKQRNLIVQTAKIGGE